MGHYARSSEKLWPSLHLACMCNCVWLSHMDVRCKWKHMIRIRSERPDHIWRRSGTHCDWMPARCKSTPYSVVTFLRKKSKEAERSFNATSSYQDFLRKKCDRNEWGPFTALLPLIWDWDAPRLLTSASPTNGILRSNHTLHSTLINTRC